MIKRDPEPPFQVRMPFLPGQGMRFDLPWQSTHGSRYHYTQRGPVSVFTLDTLMADILLI